MKKLSIPTPQDILERAKSKGWTIKRLCQEAGVSDETFSRWKFGRNSIQTDKLQAMIDALDKPELPTE